jgi:hypothetical protein
MLFLTSLQVFMQAVLEAAGRYQSGAKSSIDHPAKRRRRTFDYRKEQRSGTPTEH